MNFISLSNKLKEILTHELKGIRQSEVTKLISKYQKEIDIIFSLTLETKNITISTKYNSVNYFDFKTTFGEVLYHYLNNDYKQLNKYIQTIHYDIQILFYFIFSKYLIRKLGKDFILQTIETYYSINDIIAMVDLPNIINSDDLPIQSLNIKQNKNIIFPVYIGKINNIKKWKIFYLIKNNGKVISSLMSTRIRKELIPLLPHTCGVIGIVGIDPKYKKKTKAYILYYNNDFSNIKNIYLGKGEYKNQLDTYNYLFKKSDVIFPLVLTKIDDKDAFIQTIKKYRHKKRTLLFDKEGVIIFKPKIIYATAKIIDYIYNDDFDIKGLIINYQNKNYNIYFNVEKTDYIYGIYNRFVKIAVFSYNDMIIDVKYNSYIPKWHHTFNNCIICKDVKYKHHSHGICFSCFNKIKIISDNLSGMLIVDKDIEADFNMVVNNVEVKGINNKIIFTPLKGYQLKLPLDDIISF